MLAIRPLLQLLLLLPAAFAVADVAANGDAAEVSLKKTLSAIGAALDFVGKNSDTANLDSVISLRSLEGQAGALLARYWTRLPMWLVARLADLRATAGGVSRLAADSVKRRTPVYFANAGHMIAEHSWDTFYPTRPLPPPSQPQKSPDTQAADFDEKFSDDCIHEFFGFEGKPRCSISEKCWRGLVLQDGLTGYSLTHQLFYLMNGIQANCLINLTATAGAHPPAGSDGSMTSIFDNLCARVFDEALKLEKNGFPATDRDLFLEQIGLCSLAGYTEVAQWRWLPVILQWQRASGCYGQFPGEQVNPQNFSPGQYGNYRRKRAEMRMPSGCLAHRTSVAMDALLAYSRRLVEVIVAAPASDGDEMEAGQLELEAM